ncbi:MAG: YebC/PmpR family DNA-binding transcriptional regulator [Candidatus Eremiobacteraeota bacterium]|nr:YebC/PmpR family DNA-binding transcriptional regulator [Candidatus Eremiobacteraeota bacterium]
MSGHSKWHNIRLKKGKVDAQRGALFTKLSKEIILAAKNGSPDPEANYRLKMAVDKARANNMPQDNIKRAIGRASGAGEREIEEIRYEGYGPAGVAVIVDAATDNRNRTASELRFLFSRNDGNLGETGSVGWMFAARGIVEVDPGRLGEDELTEKALVDGVIDVRFGAATSSGQAAEVLTEPQALMAVKDALEAQGLQVRSAQLAMEPTQTSRPAGSDAEKVLNFLDALEEHEDVQRVYSNADFDEAQLEALA